MSERKPAWVLALARLEALRGLGGWGAVWRHYKGAEYVVRDVALRESDLEPLVCYRPACGGGPTFCRPLSEWLEEVSPGVMRYERVAE